MDTLEEELSNLTLNTTVVYADDEDVEDSLDDRRGAESPASSESSSSTVWNELSTVPQISQQEALARAMSERGEKRAQASAARKEAGDLLKDQGNALYLEGKYMEAVSSYSAAIEVNGARPVYLSNMAAAFLKLQAFQEAEDVASRALMQDPKFIKARYRRAMARKEMGLFKASQIDFQTVIDAEPTNVDANAGLDAVNALRSASLKMKEEWAATQTTKYPYQEEPDECMGSEELAEPGWGVDPVEIASMSDSSECRHQGHGSSFGFPCRFYNSGGCSRGKACSYSHAPDDKSVRDGLGRNVCIYHLLGNCKFGSVKCVYSHNRECLPKGGWWNDLVLTEKVRAVKNLEQASEREQRALDGLLKKLKHQKNPSKKQRNQPQQQQPQSSSTSTKTYSATRQKKLKGPGGGRGRGGGGGGRQADSKPPRAPRRSQQPRDPSDGAGQSRFARPRSPTAQLRYDDGMVERDLNGGFTDYELNELLAQGVKPWDDDAWDVLAALRY